MDHSTYHASCILLLVTYKIKYKKKENLVVDLISFFVNEVTISTMILNYSNGYINFESLSSEKK